MLAGKRMSEPQPTVFIVDDEDHIRRYCDAILRHACLPTELHSSASEFLSRYDHERPGCMILDVRMPVMSGLELQEELNRRGATIPVIFVTGISEAPVAVEAMRHGAFDYLVKPVSREDLLNRVHRALDFDAAIRASLVQRSQAGELFDTLTEREREILYMIMGGFSNKEAARRLQLSPRTVEIHRASLLKKTQVRNTAHLVRMAMELNIRPSGDARTQ
jgi:two-component system, LuxR family, response regulator FixJ